jgi:hypothetical protein
MKVAFLTFPVPANVACVTPNENSRLGIRTWVAGSVRTASHFWKQQRSRWWLQNAVTLPTYSFSAIPRSGGSSPGSLCCQGR